MRNATTEYGRWQVEHERQSGIHNSDVWFVRDEWGDADIRVNTGKDGKILARTLAATLDSAGVTDTDDVIPPNWRPDRHNGDEWEQWAGESLAVPAKVACAGKAAVAGWLKVIHKQSASWIATEMDVSEQTVRQYLSDLREGRR